MTRLSVRLNFSSHIFTGSRKASVGFTLIELIVAFSVMAILATVGVASFVSYSRAQALQQTTNDLVTALNTARAKTVAQIKPAGCSSLNGYDIVLTKGVSPNPDSYTLNAVCNGTDVLVTTTKFPKGLSLHGNNTIKIAFSVLTGGVNAPVNTVTIDGVGSSKTINIDQGGNIQVQ